MAKQAKAAGSGVPSAGSVLSALHSQSVDNLIHILDARKVTQRSE